jgi:hypothetical protein
MKKHIFIATPAFNNKVNVQYALSLLNLNIALNINGVVVTNYVSNSGSLLVAERNKLIEEFYRSDATHILCIDSDLGFPAEAVVSMLAQDKEFICGIYPARAEDERIEFLVRPKFSETNGLISDRHLLLAEYVPAGFMLISRGAIEKMRNKFPELYYQPKAEDKKEEHAYMFFNTEVHEGEFWGEDFVFCRRAREAGIDIWVDPLIQFDHNGKLGMFIEYLKTNNLVKIEEKK